MYCLIGTFCCSWRVCSLLMKSWKSSTAAYKLESLIFRFVLKLNLCIVDYDLIFQFSLCKVYKFCMIWCQVITYFIFFLYTYCYFVKFLVENSLVINPFARPELTVVPKVLRWSKPARCTLLVWIRLMHWLILWLWSWCNAMTIPFEAIQQYGKG